MSDERVRELERRVAVGDPEASRLLRIEQQRLGLRFTFPPRHKVRRSERPDRGWCPVCRRWSIVHASQKQRLHRRKKKRRPTRFCTALVRWDHPAAEPYDERGGQAHPAVIGQLVSCRGPAKGQDTTAPLEALEVEFDRLSKEWVLGSHLLSWFSHRIAVTRRKLGLLESLKPCGHPPSRVDYFDDARRHVRCKDCQVVLDPETGRVVRW